jgi:AGZA family xanthine/uracil permease-like MFS transporter
VAEQANLLEQGRLPRASRALLVDATGITAGACLGTSTVTCYIESAAGVAAGGRTGMTSVVAGLLFLVALVFSPLVGVIGRYPPITAPALVVVGSMMMRQAVKVEWDDASEAVPAFLTMAAIPLSYSIADGLAIGFAAYPAVKILSGRWRDLRWLSVVMAILLVLYFVFVRTRLA